jgi:hypothetical protein
MSRVRIRGCLVALLAGLAVPCSAQPDRVLKLAFEPDGRVNLEAANVSAREILAEWARLCGCYVVNGDRLPATPLPVPIQFPHARQAEVLQSLLRPAGGYVLTPQRPGSTSQSVYETIFVVASASPAARPPAPFAAPLSPIVPLQPVTAGSPDDEIPPVQPVAPGVILPDAQNAGQQRQQPPQPPAPASGGPAPPPPAAGVSAVPLPIVPIGTAPPPRPPAPAQPAAPAGNQPPPSLILPRQ